MSSFIYILFILKNMIKIINIHIKMCKNSFFYERSFLLTVGCTTFATKNKALRNEGHLTQL